MTAPVTDTPRRRIPAARPSWVRPVLLANLIAEVGIVVTGGIVRVTGSGLGCPTWPECVEGSIAPTSEQAEGIHKIIEFGNRLLTGVLLILALASIWVVWTHFRRRRRMKVLSVAILVGVLAQAVAGGITVLLGLHPATVAFHFLMSMLLIAVSTALLRGARDEVDGPGPLLVHPTARTLAWATYALGFVVLVLGTIVTGSGPHSGDADTPARTGFDPRVVSWLHADAVMLFVGLALATFVAVRITSEGERRVTGAWTAVLAVSVLQGAIGYVQYFTGLPEVLVVLHMLGASLFAVALTYGVLELRRNPV